MPLQSCPDCGREVSTSAASCPSCGHPFGGQPQRPRGRGGSGAARWVGAGAAVVCAMALSYLALRTTPEQQAQLEEGAQLATIRLMAAAVWEDQYYLTRNKYGWMHEIRDALPDVEALSVLETRHIDLSTSADGAAFLAIASDDDGRVSCAMYQRGRREADATNANAPLTSKIYRTEGWPDDLGTVQCRRENMPWRLLHWAGLGYMSGDQVSSALRDAAGSLRGY